MEKGFTETDNCEVCPCEEAAGGRYRDYIRDTYRQTEAYSKEALHAHLGDGIVFTGTWAGATDCQELDEEELLEGELSASVFDVGCYTVRIAECLYMDDGSRDVRHMENVTAEQDKKAADPKKGQDIGRAMAVPYLAGKESRMLAEVSAQYTPVSRATVNHWQNICIATGSHTWTESIGYICAVKSSEKAPDSQAALFVLARPAGSPQDAWKWYRFTPDSKAEECDMGGSGYSGAAAREP